MSKIEQISQIYDLILLIKLDNEGSHKILEIQRKLLKIQLEINLEKHKNIVGYGQLAVNFYNMATQTTNQLYLQKAINILKSGFNQVQQNLAWQLQLAALYSSHNKHKQSYKCSKVAIQDAVKILRLSNSNIQENQLIRDVLNQYWQSNNEAYIKSKDKKKSNGKILNKKLSDNIDIADVMQMNILSLNHFQKQDNNGINWLLIILYLSIGCFTKATENYYMKSYSQKHFHLKSINIAKKILNQESILLQFLQTTFENHYGNYLMQIQEQNSEISELIYKLPKETREISMKKLNILD